MTSRRYNIRIRNRGQYYAAQNRVPCVHSIYSIHLLPVASHEVRKRFAEFVTLPWPQEGLSRGSCRQARLPEAAVRADTNAGIAQQDADPIFQWPAQGVQHIGT